MVLTLFVLMSCNDAKINNEKDIATNNNQSLNSITKNKIIYRTDDGIEEDLEVLSDINERIRSTYRVGEILDIGMIFEKSPNFVVEFNGVQINENIELTNVGSYDLIIFDKDNNSKSILITLNVVETNDSEYIDVFSEINSKNKRVYKTDDLIVDEQIFYHNEGILELWYHIYLDDKFIGLSKSSLSDYDETLDFNLMFAKGTFSTPGNEFEKVAFDPFDENYLIYIDDQYLNHEPTVAFYNLNNDIITRYNSSIRNFVFNDKRDSFIIEEYVGQAKSIDSLKVNYLNEYGIEVIDTNILYDYGLLSFEWKNDHRFEIEKLMSSLNDYEQIGQMNVVKYIYDLENHTIIDSNLEALVDQVDRFDKIDRSTVSLYEDISITPNLIKTVEYSSVKYSEYINTFSVVNNELVVWFKITTNDDLNYYTYRLIHNNDDLLSSQVNIMLDTGLFELISRIDLETGINVKKFIPQQGFYLLEMGPCYYWSVDSQSGEASEIYVSGDERLCLIKEEQTSYVLYAINDSSLVKLATLAYDADVLGFPEWTRSNDIIFSLNPSVKVYFDNNRWISNNEIVCVESKEVMIRVNATMLNVRDNPSIDSNIVDKLKEREYKSIMGFDLGELYSDEAYKWYQIGENQWVASEFCDWIVSE